MTLTSVWAVEGSRPTVVRQNGRKSIWVFGIVDPATGRSMLAPHQEANTAPMQTFLCGAAKNLGPREQAVMVLDRAGWHIAKQLKWPRRRTPLFLPPYSPELNPAERLWLWFREHDWSNRVYPDEAALIQQAKKSHRSLRRAQVRSVRSGDIAIHTRGDVVNHLRHERSPSRNDGDQWLAIKGLSMPPDFIESPLHRLVRRPRRAGRRASPTVA